MRPLLLILALPLAACTGDTRGDFSNFMAALGSVQMPPPRPVYYAPPQPRQVTCRTVPMGYSLQTVCN